MDGYGYSQVGGFGDSPATPAQGSRGSDVHLPVDVATVQTGVLETSDKVAFAGHEFSHVALLGRVEEMTTEASKVELLVSDDSSTESLRVTMFVSDSAKPNEIMEEMYVHVFGRVRVFGGVKGVTAYKVIPILKNPELKIKLHKAEAEFARLYYQKDVKGKVSEAMAFPDKHPALKGTMFLPKKEGTSHGSSAAVGAALGSSAAVGTAMMGGGAPPGSRAVSTGRDPHSLRSRVKDAISHFVRTSHGGDFNIGTSIKDIAGFLESVPYAQVNKACFDLASDGEIYNTDDDHYSLIL